MSDTPNIPGLDTLATQGIEGNTRLNLGVGVLASNINGLLNEYNRTMFNCLVQELLPFRKLEAHILSGTLTQEVALELLEAAKSSRAETAQKVTPLVRRLQALLPAKSPSNSTNTTATESTNPNEH